MVKNGTLGTRVLHVLFVAVCKNEEKRPEVGDLVIILITRLPSRRKPQAERFAVQLPLDHTLTLQKKTNDVQNCHQ